MPYASTTIAATTASTATSPINELEAFCSSDQTTPCDDVSQTITLEIIAPAKGAVTRPLVNYRSTGIQTSPPANAKAFHEIYDKEPTHNDIEHKMGLAGIGRYKKPTDKLHGAQLGEEFELLPPQREPAYVSSGFQIAVTKARTLAIAKAKAKAAMSVSKWKATAAEEGFTIWGETREEKIVHSEQFSVRIKLDKEGNAQPDEDLTGRFLPNIYKEDMVIDVKFELEKTSTSPLLKQRKIIRLPSHSTLRSASPPTTITSSSSSHLEREYTPPRAIPALEPSSRLDLEEPEPEPEPEEPKPEKKPRRVTIPGVWGYYEVWDEDEPEPEPEPEPYEEDSDAYVVYNPARLRITPTPTAETETVPPGLLREPPKGPSRKRKDSSRLESDEERRQKRFKTESSEVETSSSPDISSLLNDVSDSRHTRSPLRYSRMMKDRSPGRRYQHDSPRQQRERSRDTLRDRHGNRSRDRDHRALSRERSPPRREKQDSTGCERKPTGDTVRDRYRERSPRGRDHHATSILLEEQHHGIASRRDDSRETHSRSKSRHGGGHQSSPHRPSQRRGQADARRSRSPVKSDIEGSRHRDRSLRKTHRGPTSQHDDRSQSPPRKPSQRRAQEDVRRTRGRTRSRSPMNSATEYSRPVRDRQEHCSDRRHDAHPVIKERDQHVSNIPKQVAHKVWQDLAEIVTAKPVPTTPKLASSCKKTAVPRTTTSRERPAASSSLPTKTEAPKDAVNCGNTRHAADSSSSIQPGLQENTAPELPLVGIAIKGQGPRTNTDPRRGPHNAQHEAFEARKKEMKSAHQRRKRSLEESDPASSMNVDDQSKRAKLAPKDLKKEERKERETSVAKTGEAKQHKSYDDTIRTQQARVQDQGRTATATKSPKETAKSTQVEQKKNDQPESRDKSDNLKPNEVNEEAEKRKRDIKARIAQRHANRGRRVEAGRYVPPASRENGNNALNNGGNRRAGRSQAAH